MRIAEIIIETAGVGKIVKGINTTIDVRPGEIKRQAAKLGLSVDSNGTPPVANPNGSDALKENISGQDLLDILHAQHHDEPGLNLDMEDWVKKQHWTLREISPDQLPDHYGDDLPYEPFNRVIDIDDATVQLYARKLASGQKIQPIIMGPNGSVVDGNHRAMAARLTNKPIMAYVPIGLKISNQY